VGTFSGPGNGDDRAEWRQALQAISASAAACALPLGQVIIRVDGVYGHKAPVTEILSGQCGVIGRGKEDGWRDLPDVQTRLPSPPEAQVTHPESRAVRDRSDGPVVSLTPAGPVVRLVVSTHPAGDRTPASGVVRNETVYERFSTTFPPHAFPSSDVLHLCLHRGSCETVLSDDDHEHDLDRWVSRSPCGQDCWQIISQWMWNLR
jgi:hypothetical protein